MRIAIRGSLVLAAMLSATAAVAGAQTTRVTLAPESKLWLEGNSTLHAYSCKAGEIKTTIDADASIRDGDLLTATRSVKEGDLTIPVKSLKCGNGQMDNNMYKALKATQFTTITYRMTTYDVAPRAGDPAQVVVTTKGTLTIAGTEKPVTVELTAVRLPDGTFKLEGSRDLLMTDFNVSPPRLMMGAVKTDNKVVVKFDLLVRAPEVVAARE